MAAGDGARRPCGLRVRVSTNAGESCGGRARPLNAAVPTEGAFSVVAPATMATSRRRAASRRPQLAAFSAAASAGAPGSSGESAGGLGLEAGFFGRLFRRIRLQGAFGGLLCHPSQAA